MKMKISFEFQIEKGSLAYRQGEFQCGDQIIQINNIKVFNREQAIQLIQGVSLLIFQIIRFQVKFRLFCHHLRIKFFSFCSSNKNIRLKEHR